MLEEVQHMYLSVNTDQKKEENFDGTLADFACKKLNESKQLIGVGIKIISIETCYWSDEIRPRQDNSSTWYERRSLRLSVFYTNKRWD